jgi:polyphosphate kinase
VEVEFPVRDARLARRIRDEILGCYLADTVKARLLATNGNYTRPSGRKQSRFNAQEHLIAVAEGTARSNVVSLAPRPTTERKRIKTG